MKNQKSKGILRNKLEDQEKDSLENLYIKYKRGKSLHVKLNNKNINKIKNNIANKSADNKININLLYLNNYLVYFHYFDLY